MKKDTNFKIVFPNEEKRKVNEIFFFRKRKAQFIVINKEDVPLVRHLLIKTSYHGFHHNICADTSFHRTTPDSNCKFRLCNDTADQYHALQCSHLQGKTLSAIEP
ncbi:hypothetical protein GQR58_014080 [Nymphon striatum]|nr:hypothetical protein GQR58_014080 [Nymphon striatum]